MTESGSLTPKQARALAALMRAATIGLAAQEAGVGERSLRRWLQEPAFRAALAEAEAAVIDDAVRAALSDLDANRQVMKMIRDDPDNGPTVKLRAAGQLDDWLFRWRVQASVEQRLAALEAALLRDDDETD